MGQLRPDFGGTFVVEECAVQHGDLYSCCRMTVCTVGPPFFLEDVVKPVKDDQVFLRMTEARSPRAGVENVALHVQRMVDGMS